ncbi:MAG: hypothetical protein A2528_00840 [Candidatus Staskawiczbacteria bacterium RIFOXYD2_FULL_37_9]|nr:MAG: hypothetical protein A2416_00040 [Candidatus Staskawiczbacteria bacterium RIFOXYC1_FULL_37_52]OGZ89871.1 MAG: hypothetical protein A2581_00825 [Candidatus Staskawiczbacteria bacterium RIFOXYD1_FULL_37_110]OGZ94771.1 MAG: hypothetical protein A2528_00840 [Candidatus Staskawiczbacteria bacterium RIFOXYD2_FULL_37_9]
METIKSQMTPEDQVQNIQTLQRKNSLLPLIIGVTVAIIALVSAILFFIFYKPYLQKKIIEELVASFGVDMPSPYVVSGPFIVSPSYNGINIITSTKASEILNAKKEIDVRFLSVLDSNGQEVLDKESSFETKPFWTKKMLDKSNDPVEHYKADRSISVLENFSGEFSAITGTIYIDSIQGQKTYSFSKDQLSSLSSSSDSKIKIGEFEENYLTVIVSGDLNKLVSVTAYDSSNNELEREGKGDADGGLNVYYETAKIDKLVVIYANNIVRKAYPFTLKIDVPENSKINETASDNISTEEKKQIIKSLAYMYDLLSTKNVSKIRDFFMQQVPESADEINATIDEEILSAAEMITLFGKPTEDLLTDPNATWSIDGDTAKIEIKNEDGSASSSFSIEKINGVWPVGE